MIALFHKYKHLNILSKYHASFLYVHASFCEVYVHKDGLRTLGLWFRQKQVVIKGFPQLNSKESTCDAEDMDIQIWSVGQEGPLEEVMAMT